MSKRIIVVDKAELLAFVGAVGNVVQVVQFAAEPRNAGRASVILEALSKTVSWTELARTLAQFQRPENCQGAAPRAQQSCSWCDTLNVIDPARPVFCSHCEHRADLPRILCDCERCGPPATQVSAHPASAAEKPNEGGQ
jgi:hypothetical protein